MEKRRQTRFKAGSPFQEPHSAAFARGLRGFARATMWRGVLKKVSLSNYHLESILDDVSVLLDPTRSLFGSLFEPGGDVPGGCGLLVELVPVPCASGLRRLAEICVS